jgi:hypothetical protein
MLWTRKNNNGKVIKGNNSLTALGRVIVLVHCTSS